MNDKAPPGQSAEPSELDELRAAIDRVDVAILEQLNRRANLVERVGEFKASRGKSVYSAGRERNLLQALAAKNPGPFPDEALGPVFREIVSGTRSLERRLRVAYLGPEGTFSHLAALEAFGRQVEFLPFASFPEVLAAVASSRADHGVLPVENSTEGVVTQALDCLVDADVTIAGELLLRISLCMMSRTGDLSDVKKVASHPQPLAQARRWLDQRLSGSERLEFSSTAEAARLAAQSPEVAAIGASICGEAEGLKLVARGIEDRHDNTTRFLILGGEPPAASGTDLTSVVFTMRKDQSGALHRLLEPFATHDVNLTSIQSRPLKGAPWEYLFFIDLEGHRDSPALENAIDAASRIAHSTRVLGSFPRASEARNGEVSE